MTNNNFLDKISTMKKLSKKQLAYLKFREFIEQSTQTNKTMREIVKELNTRLKRTKHFSEIEFNLKQFQYYKSKYER